jgi:hypothetical protein
VDDELEAPVAGPQVGRALQQALHGLGVRSFSDLGVFDPSTSDAG